MTNYGRLGSVKSQSKKTFALHWPFTIQKLQRRHLDKDSRHAHAEHSSLKQHGGKKCFRKCVRNEKGIDK